jgi:hypothetical protein
MRKSNCLRSAACLVIVLAGLAGGPGAALAQTAKDDPNIDPILPDPVPDGHLFPPAMATAGTGDPGREFLSSPVSARMLAGHGPGCVPTSPCAVNSPPLTTLGPVAPANAAPVKAGAGG